MSGSSGSPAETIRRSEGSGRRVVRRASIRYSVGAWQRTLIPSRSSEVEPLRRVEAAVVDDRGGAGQPGGEEDVAGRLRPAGRGRAPGELAGPRAEPVGRLDRLAEQVAVGVDDAARVAGRAGGEDDQRRVLGVHLLDRGRRLLRPVLVEHVADLVHRHRRHPGRQPLEQPLLADAEGGLGGLHPVARGRAGAAACCRAAPPRPSASRRASRAPTRSGCRPASSPRRRASPRGRGRRPRGRPSRRSVRRSASRAGRRRRRSRRSPGARPASAPAGRRSGSRRASLRWRRVLRAPRGQGSGVCPGGSGGPAHSALCWGVLRLGASMRCQAKAAKRSQAHPTLPNGSRSQGPVPRQAPPSERRAGFRR